MPGIVGEVEESVPVAQESRVADGRGVEVGREADVRRRRRPPGALHDRCEPGRGNARARGRRRRGRSTRVPRAARATAPFRRSTRFASNSLPARLPDIGPKRDPSSSARRDRRRLQSRRPGGEHLFLDARHRQRRHRDLLAVEVVAAVRRREHVDVMADEMLALARGIAAAADRHPEAGQHERARERSHRVEIAAT